FSDDDEEYTGIGTDLIEDEGQQLPSFPDLEQQIWQTIEEFDAHDLDHAFEDCSYEEESLRRQRPDVFELVLRKWYDVAPSMEFRCFVRNEELVVTGPPIFRIITSQSQANQSRSQPFATNRLPREVFDFSQGQTVVEFAERFQRELMIKDD
ncbi:7192_t:CDS:2, partial [Racocetra fulgida]